MDLKHRFPHSLRKKRRKGDTAQLAAQLAPLEEQNKNAARKQTGAVPGLKTESVNHEHGAIIVDNSGMAMPKGVIEGSDQKEIFGLEPVVLVILVVMLSFIAFVAWQISLMPPQTQ